MAFDPTYNELLDRPLTEELLPDAMRLAGLDYAHRNLVYVLRRPDNDFTAPTLEPLLRQARRCRPEFIKDFYANLAGLAHALSHYMRMEESCTMSGKYRKDLDSARDRVGRVLAQFEESTDRRELRYLQGMID